MWAVGSFSVAAGTTGRTLVEHWNGSAWSIVTSRNATNDNLLNGVGAAAGDVWAVGTSEVTAHTLALRETG
jgi:hypothetical protein